MMFWCVDCEIMFDGEPMSAAYEQTVCPTCSRDCLTFESELEDARKIAGQRDIFGNVFTAFMSLLGLAPGIVLGSSGAAPAIVQYAERMNINPPLVELDSEDDALMVRHEFGEHGIICEIIFNEFSKKYEIQVETRDRRRAIRLLEGD